MGVPYLPQVSLCDLYIEFRYWITLSYFRFFDLVGETYRANYEQNEQNEHVSAQKRKAASERFLSCQGPDNLGSLMPSPVSLKKRPCQAPTPNHVLPLFQRIYRQSDDNARHSLLFTRVTMSERFRSNWKMGEMATYCIASQEYPGGGSPWPLLGTDQIPSPPPTLYICTFNYKMQKVMYIYYLHWNLHTYAYVHLLTM